MKRRRFLLGACLALLAGAARAQDCTQAAARAEQAFGLPRGLLAAIGRVESGRRDPATGQVAAWPWTIDARGEGAFLPSRDAAMASVRALQLEGVRSIDVGCFQVNLLHHPAAFASLEEAFDPEANARYAARFLVELHDGAGSWPAAAMRYHSALPERGLPYRDRVLASWGSMAPALPVAPVPGLRIWTPSVSGPSIINISHVSTRLPNIVVPALINNISSRR